MRIKKLISLISSTYGVFIIIILLRAYGELQVERGIKGTSVWDLVLLHRLLSNEHMNTPPGYIPRRSVLITLKIRFQDPKNDSYNSTRAAQYASSVL